MATTEKLKTARRHLNKDQKAMAHATGTSYRTWQAYERGERFPSGKVFKRLTDLGFSADWFFTEDENIPMLIKEVTALSSQHQTPPSVKENEGCNIHTALATKGHICGSQPNNMDFEALTFIYKELEILRKKTDFTKEEEVDIAFLSYNFCFEKNHKTAQAICTLFNKWKKCQEEKRPL